MYVFTVRRFPFQLSILFFCAYLASQPYPSFLGIRTFFLLIHRYVLQTQYRPTTSP